MKNGDIVWYGKLDITNSGNFKKLVGPVKSVLLKKIIYLEVYLNYWIRKVKLSHGYLSTVKRDWVNLRHYNIFETESDAREAMKQVILNFMDQTTKDYEELINKLKHAYDTL